MALIIKGDMPKGCILDCHYFGVNKYYDERDGKTHKCVYCALNDDIRYKDCGFPDEYEHTRHPNCLIKGEIPDKHGRLIDADVIGNWLREQHVFSMPTTCKIDSIIKDAPIVIPVSEEAD